MKLISYLKEDHDQLAFLVDGMLYDSDRLHPDLPVTMTMFLNYWEDIFPIAHMINLSLIEGNRRFKGKDINDVQIIAPVPHPVSFRNAYRSKQTDDQFPSFYFANHNSIQGPGEIVCMPDHLNKLDFEVEIGIVICKPCKNIKASEADEYIGGFMIMNSISSGEKLNPALAQGKDFSTVIGPMLITIDELEEFITEAKKNHTGNAYNLAMKCWINDAMICEGNTVDMDWTFAEIIERCSYGVQLFPGDIIGFGIAEASSFFKLNNIGKLNDPDFEEQWLKEGDEMEIEIENLGRLKNSIVKDESDF